MRRSSRRSASGRFGFLGWLALGAGLASLGFTFLDPARGAARRAMLRDRTSTTLRRIGGQTRGRLLDASSRVRGRVQKLRGRLGEGEVRGGTDVVERFDVHEEAGSEPSRQGAKDFAATRFAR